MPQEVTLDRVSPDLSDHALADKIRLLLEDRAKHAEAIRQIDDVLARVQRALVVTGSGAPTTAGAPGALQPVPDGPRRHYQKLPQTGEESVIAFVRRSRNPTTAQVNAHWKSEGRPGVANPTLARLLKRGVLQRENDPGVRGSRYRVVNTFGDPG